MISIDYINYWENVVRAWLDYDIQNKDFRKEIKQVILYPDLQDVLRTHQIPGPYMGNPDNASIVILNYNPGGRDNMNPMKSHTCLCCDRNYYSIINYVNRHGYYNFAKDFPYLNDNVDDELKKSLDGGKRWWMSKKEWIDNLTKQSTIFPFAMELCGWHSKKWPSNILKKLDNKTGLGKHIDETVIQPMIDVIRKNKTFGVCIGKTIGDLLLNFGFKNVTNALGQSLNVLCNGSVDNINVLPNNNGYNIVANSNNKKGRYYRLLQFGDDVYILNTWVNGSNNHSSKEYFDFEQQIVDFLIKKSNNQIIYRR